MGYIFKICVATTVILVANVYFSLKPYFEVPPVPKLEEKWWGVGELEADEGKIVPFRINVSDEAINDLNRRLENHIPFQEPLEGIQHHYGINTQFLTTVIEFWRKKYCWMEREEFMNQYPQYKVNIQGLNIHFLHIKPVNASGLKVFPMLLLHGWPSSVREFYDIIPFLTHPREDRDFVFELIIPSIPGFGFSDASHRPGLSAAHISVIFKNLMKRLGFEKYYVQGGGGVGGVITQYLAILYPKNIIGVHSNFCFVDTPLSIVKLIFASFYPPLFVNKDMEDKVFPLFKIWSDRILESGHLHIQATKPDTVGVALRDSPVGLAAYILEKFITWTNPKWKDLDDGGLHLKYILTDLLDNIMVYWITGSMTTSMRIYVEHFHKDTWELGMDRIPISEVPSGCMRFWNDVHVLPDFILRENIVSLFILVIMKLDILQLSKFLHSCLKTFFNLFTKSKHR